MIAPARRLGDRQHAPIYMCRHARYHVFRRAAQTLGPVRAHEIVVAANAARCDDDGLRLQRKLAHGDPRAGLAPLDRARFKDLALHAIDDSAAHRQRVDAMAKQERDQPLLARMRTRRTNGASTPGPVPQVRWKRGTELP